MLKWFDAHEERAFGRSIAEFYVARVPFESPFSSKQFAAKTQDTLRKIDAQIQQFKTGHKLNVYKKAKLGNAFMWVLRDKGYDANYVGELTEWLMHRI